MSNAENDERENDPSATDADAAHPFDQINGVVEGLEGDADDPEQVDKRAGNGNGVGFLAAPAPGSQMPGGAIPVSVAAEAGADDEAEADDPDSSGD